MSCFPHFYPPKIFPSLLPKLAGYYLSNYLYIYALFILCHNNHSQIGNVVLEEKHFQDKLIKCFSLLVPLLLLVSSITAGILLLVLLVFVVVCLVFRRRQRANQPGVLVQTHCLYSSRHIVHDFIRLLLMEVSRLCICVSVQLCDF